MVIRHLENRIKLVGTVCTLVIIGAVIISVASFFGAASMVSSAHKQIYVLDGTVPVLVNQTTQEVTYDVEAKSHIELFHHLFFTLAPDEKYIRYTQEKAMYLVDESGIAQLNMLKEKGLFSNIIGSSAVLSIFCDSIQLDEQNNTFRYYGRQRIERTTDVTYRSLITTGSLRRVPRTDKNPHGLLITNWRTLQNNDIEHRKKQRF